MTRAWRLVLAVSAALAIAAGVVSMRTPYARQPLVAEAPYGTEIGRETSCGANAVHPPQGGEVWTC